MLKSTALTEYTLEATLLEVGLVCVCAATVADPWGGQGMQRRLRRCRTPSGSGARVLSARCSFGTKAFCESFVLIELPMRDIMDEIRCRGALGAWIKNIGAESEGAEEAGSR